MMNQKPSKTPLSLISPINLLFGVCILFLFAVCFWSFYRGVAGTTSFPDDYKTHSWYIWNFFEAKRPPIHCLYHLSSYFLGKIWFFGEYKIMSPAFILTVCVVMKFVFSFWYLKSGTEETTRNGQLQMAILIIVAMAALFVMPYPQNDHL